MRMLPLLILLFVALLALVAWLDWYRNKVDTTPTTGLGAPLVGIDFRPNANTMY